MPPWTQWLTSLGRLGLCCWGLWTKFPDRAQTRPHRWFGRLGPRLKEVCFKKLLSLRGLLFDVPWWGATPIWRLRSKVDCCQAEAVPDCNSAFATPNMGMSHQRLRRIFYVLTAFKQPQGWLWILLHCYQDSGWEDLAFISIGKYWLVLFVLKNSIPPISKMQRFCLPWVGAFGWMDYRLTYLAVPAGCSL